MHVSPPVNEQFYPAYHLAPPFGWCNDPNGLCFFKGLYHVFYQYYPYGTTWGPMHWAHATSGDLIKYRNLPIALSPDKRVENGCFSGGAVVSPDGGLLTVIYTKHRVNFLGIRQTQAIATSEDGINFNKSNKTVISSHDLPKGYLKRDFRDPNPILINGKYYVFIASRTRDAGAILVYRSSDMNKYVLLSEIKLKLFDGVMPECPDMFELDGKYVLLTSLCNVKSKDWKYNTSHTCVYITGDFDAESGSFTAETIDEIDCGTDFYAPQTLSDGKRRIMLAWMNHWRGKYLLHEDKHGWNGAFTFPRELKLSGGKLIQTPAAELEKYRADTVDYRSEATVPKTQDISALIQADGYIRYYNTEDEFDYFEVGADKKGLYLDGSNLKNEPRARRYSKLSNCGEYEVRVLLDKSSVEVFVNGGRDTITSTVYINSSHYRAQLSGAVVTEAYLINVTF